jgi:hypothetical protein
VSHEGLLFAVVVGYVAIVLWCLAFGDSLRALGDLLTRLGGRRLRGRRYTVGILAGALIAGLAAGAVVVIRDSGPAGKVSPEAALKPQANRGGGGRQAPRPVSPTVIAAHAHARASARPARRRTRPATRVRKTRQMVRTSYVVRTVSEPQAPAPTPVAAPSPLPAPPESSGPRPLKAP